MILFSFSHVVSERELALEISEGSWATYLIPMTRSYTKSWLGAHLRLSNMAIEFHLSMMLGISTSLSSKSKQD